ncbi:MAG: SRPBCC domain-containing protein [Planctomycetes bacterium]|nr:SRPBCC domain-containing protein [Planctomycetota bacterium]
MVAIPLITSARDDGGELVHEGVVNAPIGAVWQAFTTREGLESWMAPHARIDLKVGGKMRTHYDPDGVIGDPKTIENTILSFDPPRMLSLKATKPPAGFPFMEAIKSTWSVLYFEELGPKRTRITIRGLGYGNDEQSLKMREFFDMGNAWTLARLREHFDGQPEALAASKSPTEGEDAPSQRAQARNEETNRPERHWVYFLRPARDGFFDKPTPEETRIVGDHAQYIRRMLEEGRLVVAGPAFDPAYYPDSGGHAAPLEMPTPGIVIFRARDLTEAKRIMESDPAVRAGVFMARLNAFKLAFIRK